MPKDLKSAVEINMDQPAVEAFRENPENPIKEAEKVVVDIDNKTDQFVASEKIENPDLAQEAKVVAESSKAEIDRVVNNETASFDYSGANDWIELYSMIGQHMSVQDADMVVEQINALRAGKITEKDLSVTPNSHIREVVLNLQQRDNLLNEKPSEPVIDQKIETPATTEVPKAELDLEPVAFEFKHDVRDARFKGGINRLKALLDEMNIAIQKSDRTLQQRSLEQAAVLLNDPRFAAQSTELPASLEQAQIAAENKIRELEKEMQAAQMERMIAPLKALIERINAAKTREDKLSALQEAADLLKKPELATAILQRSKDEQDLLVPDALEQAVLLAEARIRQIEEEINKIKNGVVAPEKTSVAPESEPTTVTPEETVDEEQTTQQPPEPNPDKVPGPNKPEQTPELPDSFDDARSNYFELVKKRKRIFSRDRKILVGGYKEKAEDELEQAHDDYEALKQEAIIKALQQMKEQGETDPAKLAEAYIKFLQEEEQRVDALSSAGDASTMNKFKAWWKKHWKARLAIGGGMFVLGVGATAISGGLLGPAVTSIVGSTLFGTSFVAARGIMSGTGTYMGSEAVMDIRTKKLGQKGLIDSLPGSNFYKNKDTQRQGDLLHTFEGELRERSLSELGQELARLRSMGLEKGVAAQEAGRFGAAQAPAVKILEKVYYEKLRADVLAKTAKTPDKNGKVEAQQDPEQKKSTEKQEQSDRILAALRQKTEDERAEQLLPEVDKYRKKSMIRHGVAIGLGVGIGLFSSHLAEKTAARLAGGGAPVKEVAAAAAAQHVAEKHVDYNVEAKAGDSLWKIIAAKLHETMGDEKWNSLGEAGQTHAIDSVKDAVGANPEAFGMYDIDQLVPGQHIDLSSILGQPDAIEKLQHGVEAMQAAGGEANILANNDALEAAAKAGVHLTTENVDAVAHEVREHGTGFLTADGAVHEWTLNGHAVDRLADGSFAAVDSHQVLSPDQLSQVFNHAHENAQSLVDAEAAAKASTEAATESANQAAQVTEQSANLENFMTQGGQYNHDIFEAAKNSGQLDDLVHKVISGSDQEQVRGLVHDFARDHGWSEAKTNVFLGATQHGDKVDLSSGGHFDVNDPHILSQNMEAFDKSALTSFDQIKHMPADRMMHVHFGGDNYALVQKYHTGIWPFRADHYLVDMNGDHKVDGLKFDDEAMRQAFTKTLETAKKTAAALSSRTPLGPHPPMAE